MHRAQAQAKSQSQASQFILIGKQSVGKSRLIEAGLHPILTIIIRILTVVKNRNNSSNSCSSHNSNKGNNMNNRNTNNNNSDISTGRYSQSFSRCL